ncbi:hypothetical protein [Paenibacillus konkukensis]|nr:hypothetical protein [Paenibacillus konkukensis]
MAILALMFKTFRWPFWEFGAKLSLIAVTLSVASYLIRMVWDIPSYDLAVQFILYVVLLRYLIKVSLFHAVDVTAVGCLAFNVIQFIVYFSLLAAGIVSAEEAQQPAGTGIFIIQVSCELCSFGIAYLLYRFHYGFSFLMKPPLDLYMSRKSSGGQLAKTVINTIGILAISSSVYWLLNYQEYLLILLMVILGALAILVYLYYKKDLQD